jgi:hypothetical protein
MISHLSYQTLQSLERAEPGKLIVSRAGASICWPAFVPACEAPAELRHRWSNYWHTLLSYRIDSLQTVWEVVQKMWSKVDEEAAADGNIQLHVVTPVGYETYQTSNPIWTDILRKSALTILAI